MSTFEIPTIPEPQRFSIKLGGKTYIVDVRWNRYASCWQADIADVNDNPVLDGVMLVTGADLLGQFEYLGFGGLLTASTDHDADAVPTFTNLGSEGHLYFTVP